MKKLIVIALFCIIGASVKAQSINKVASTPGSNNDYTYASDPILTLDSLTGYLHYSYTVNYPVGAQREDIIFGGSSIYILLCINAYPYQVYPVEFNNESDDYTTLPSGQVVHSGSIYIGNIYNILTLINISVSTGFTYSGDPYTYNSHQMMDEYEFIP